MSISCLHFLIGHGFPHPLSVWETLTPVCKTGDTRMIKNGLIGLTVKLLHYTYNTSHRHTICVLYFTSDKTR